MNVSVIIPVRNGLKWLQYSIPIIFQQNDIENIELIILDSESSDGLKEYISANKTFNIKHIEVNSAVFNHGETRNLGVHYSSHDILVFTVQDATPIGLDWLSSLINPLINFDLDGICGSQVVLHDPNKNPIEWYRPIERPLLNLLINDPKEFLNLTPLEQRKLTGWDNVNAAYKKTILLKYPFKKVYFGEDAYWAFEALCNGLKIAYTSYSQVDHYHHYTNSQFKSRFVAEINLHRQLYGLEPQKRKLGFVLLLRWIKTILKSHRHPKEILFWLFYNIRSRIVYNRSIQFAKTENNASILNFLLVNPTLSTKNTK